MSANQHIEHIFNVLDRSSRYIAQTLNKSYLEALIDSAENIFQGEMVIDVSKEQSQQLANIYFDFQEEQYTKEDIRRGFQLAVLKGMKEIAAPGATLTPDSVVMLAGYLMKKLIQPSSVLDLSAGAGNLLTGILNQYEHPIKAVATEVDPVFVRLAYVNVNLQQQDVEIFHQDGLKPLYTSLADLTISDLPVGLYPNQKVAKDYQLYEENKELYTHHLFIEQALRLTKPDGYLIFLIPNTLFTEPGADRLRKLVTETSYIQTLLQLPDSLFQKGSIQKSIFILQKKGETSKKPKESLLAQIPSFSDPHQFTHTLNKMNEWILAEKGEI